jgi:hypothetical protein
MAEPADPPAPARWSVLRKALIGVAVLWGVGVLVLAVMNHVDEDFQRCRTTTETVTGGEPSAKTTSTCEPASPAAIGLLLIPPVLLLLPWIEEFDVFGFGFKLREAKAELEAATDRKIEVILVERAVGDRIVPALSDPEDEEYAELPEA